jgi:hypothetical protein
VVLVLVLPAADIVHKATQRGVFHTDRLEGAWTVVAVTGGGAGHLPVEGAWDKVYFEKGDYGFVQVGARRVRFDMEFDDAAGSLRLFDFDAPKGATVSDGRSMGGTFTTEGRRFDPPPVSWTPPKARRCARSCSWRRGKEGSSRRSSRPTQ